MSNNGTVEKPSRDIPAFLRVYEGSLREIAADECFATRYNVGVQDIIHRAVGEFIERYERKDRPGPMGELHKKTEKGAANAD